MKKCKKEKENINKTTCKDCEYNDNCENVTKKGGIKMKKILLTTLTTLSIITPFAHAGERMAKDDVERVEIHKECFMHPVIVDKDVKESPYTHEVYEINAYYDAITGYRINLDYETIYIDDEGNRWYFPYDGLKFHIHK